VERKIGDRLYIWCDEEVAELFHRLERDWKRRVRRGELRVDGRPSHGRFLRYLLQLYEERHRVDRVVGWK